MPEKQPSAETVTTEKELVILGLVVEEPVHAYELEAKIQARMMADWTEISVSSVYRVLNGLEGKGLLEARLVHEGQGSTRKVYSVTDAGQAALAAGVLRLLSEVVPLKNPFQVGLAYATYAPYEDVVLALENRMSSVDEWMRKIEAIQSFHEGRESGGRNPLGGSCGNDAAEVRSDDRTEGIVPQMDGSRRLRLRMLFDHIRTHLQAEKEHLERTQRLLRGEGVELFTPRR